MYKVNPKYILRNYLAQQVIEAANEREEATAIAIAVGAVFLRVQSTTSSPLVRPQLLKQGGIRTGVIMSCLTSAVAMTTLVVGPFYLTGALHLTPASAGLVMTTGPLVAVFLKGLADRRQLVATHAMLMTLQNSFKVLVFVALGFAFASYLPLMLTMILAGFGGTALGSRLLVKVPESAFRWGFKLILTLVALDLVRSAVFG